MGDPRRTMELGGPNSARDHPPRNGLHAREAETLGARSLALVAFGTGVGGFPLEEAARIEVEEVERHLASGSGLERIVFAVHGARAREAFQAAIDGART
jgi:O-acetyl-ADP-ribose deacetylase (regulator of RNase III)